MSDATFYLVPRASILASGATDDFHHVAPDEVVLVEVETLEQARRERDEARALLQAARDFRNGPDWTTHRGHVEAIEAERDEARAEVEVWKREHAKAHGDWLETRKKAAEALAERDALKAALRGLLDNLNGYEHHPDLCSRTGECDELTPDEFCSQCGDETCPACECGLDKTQAAMQRAREALGEVES